MSSIVDELLDCHCRRLILSFPWMPCTRNHDSIEFCQVNYRSAIQFLKVQAQHMVSK
jgi:hypothetical protein